MVNGTTADPTTSPTTAPTSSPVYKEENYTRSVPGYDCENVDCDSELKDELLQLTPADACAACGSGGYLIIENENDQVLFNEDINLQCTIFTFHAKYQK